MFLWSEVNFKFFPFHLVEREFLFSIGAGQLHLENLDGDGLRIITLPLLSVWGFSSRK